ncbi:hypothetical protein [Desulfovibrio sp.]|uniref:hypothetical protein n=1 Tax=Desulfovibrio sp. TaxID=885 RepID=UPI00307964C2
MRTWASLLLALLQAGLRLLEKLDAARAAEFRRRVAADGAGVLLDQLNPGADAAGTAQPATGNSGRDAGRVDGQR